MIHAELHGKLPSEYERWEDVLTSNVFGFFKYVDRSLFVGQLLENLGVSCTVDELQTAQFLFWPTFSDGTEPDLVIDMSDHLVVFESKYFSGFAVENGEQAGQLIREVSQGRGVAEERHLIVVAITADALPPLPLIDSLPQKIRRSIRWINWQSISRLLISIVESHPGVSQNDQAFAKDLIALLERKHLRGFHSYNHLPQYLESRSDSLFFNPQTARFRGAFLGFEGTLSGLEWILRIQTNIWFSKRYFERMGQTVPRQVNRDLFFSRRQR